MSPIGAALALVVALATPSVEPSPSGRVLFHLTDPRITESSGIAVATREPGVWFTHNDSGDSARFFAVGPAGQTLATYDVDGVQAGDWEDMAAAPRNGVATLWFGDIGDNNASRPYVSVYAVPEPGVFPGLRGATVHLKAIRYRFRYPDGARDAETLMVDPLTSRIYLASKSLGGNTQVYVAPERPSPTRVNPLSEVGEIQWQPHPEEGLQNVVRQLATTGGAFAPDGRSFVLRTYTDAYVFRLQGSGVLAVGAAVAGSPRRIVLPQQPQGEGVCFRRDGKALVISSEHARSAVAEVLLPQAVPAPVSSPVVTSPSLSPSLSPSTSPTAGGTIQPAATPSSTTAAQQGKQHSHSGMVIVGGVAAVGVAAALVLVRRRSVGSARSRR